MKCNNCGAKIGLIEWVTNARRCSLCVMAYMFAVRKLKEKEFDEIYPDIIKRRDKFLEKWKKDNN